ncbi:MAG: bifunctional DNA-formamidopyrimidine glycosylase/DNA-(apurinic or apyrimidinic site) lyase [Myxococcales bacterium]|nr:bifunctional DNA-formamidopyrimidine glycosylase/DNA-(apurinic or apyrimidinic site) lyase [Myxococcales bacterium]MCB9644124.1 bifunctional DNA-formamidopyrimidine glycosylase/DNA-(apurinic or apyrimidinic site) lyase [Myxococcales bacterium]
MPELPEVETVRRGLQRVLVGQRVSKTKVLLERALEGDPKWLKGREVQDIGRRGKALLIEMDQGLTALVHLRMTGQLIFLPKDGGPREGGGHPSDALVHKLPSKHTRVILSLESGDQLFFNDQRTFGSIKLLDEAHLALDSFLSKLGPEPWSPEFSVDALYCACQRRSRSSIKSILLDQEVVAGIGNIYADESLFLTKIHPATPAGQIAKKQIKPLIGKIREVLERGIEYGGVSARDYVNAEGLRGRMQEQLYVYGRDGMPCKVCGTVLEKTRTAGRGTHFCPKCQGSL